MSLSLISPPKPLGVAFISEKLGPSSPCTPTRPPSTLGALTASWHSDFWRRGLKGGDKLWLSQGGGEWIYMHLLYDNLRETLQGPIAIPPSNHDIIIPHKLFSGSDWHARYGVSGGEPSRLEAWEQGGTQRGYNGLPFLRGNGLLSQSMSCCQVQAWAVQGDKRGEAVPGLGPWSRWCG